MASPGWNRLRDGLAVGAVILKCFAVVDVFEARSGESWGVLADHRATLCVPSQWDGPAHHALPT